MLTDGFSAVRCRDVHTVAIGLMWPLAVGATIGIVAGSLAPADVVPTFAPDYALHFVGYGGAALVWLVAVVWCPGEQTQANVHSRRLRGNSVLAVLIAFGAILELTQQFVGRSTEVRDLFANIAGAGLGWVVWTRLVQICDLVETEGAPIGYAEPDLDETSASV